MFLQGNIMIQCNIYNYDLVGVCMVCADVCILKLNTFLFPALLYTLSVNTIENISSNPIL